MADNYLQGKYRNDKSIWLQQLNGFVLVRNAKMIPPADGLTACDCGCVCIGIAVSTAVMRYVLHVECESRNHVSARENR